MSPESFCYWLQGYFEISGSKNLTSEQIEVIQEHLSLVFTKVTNQTVQTNIPKPTGPIKRKE